jgi:beta-fructofuranosidase
MNEIEKANTFIKEHKHQANPMYRNHYHLMAPIGWINDPNGFIFFKEEYHLFYQYYPYDSIWGPMHWGHAKSKDLIHWEDLPVALAPSESYDADGCFSGTAIEKDGKLYLFYTGHVENSLIKREVQCFAVSEDGIHFEKSAANPIIDESHIKDIATCEDFRDPKIFERNGVFYMLVATKTAESCGQILLFESQNFEDWSFKSVFLEGKPNQGVMWECPDYFQLSGKDVLLLSPIQMNAQGNQYKNRSSTVAFIGKVDWEHGKLTVENYHEIDGGLDFYAPQTCQNAQGQRFLIAWMQMWDRNMPTNELKHGWAGSMSLPRELYIENNYLKQKPIAFADDLLKLKKSISKRQLLQDTTLEADISNNYYVDLTIDVMEAEKITLNCGKRNGASIQLTYDVAKSLLSINREEIGHFIEGVETPVLNTRELVVQLEHNKLGLTIYGDTSSIEVFTSTGQAMTTTFFEESGVNLIELKTKGTCLIEKMDVFDIIVE